MKTHTDMTKITVQDTEVTVVGVKGEDYICITDLARFKNAEHTDDIIKNWIRNRNTIELLGIWDLLHNPHFKPVEFEGFKQEAGLNAFTLSPQKWIDATNAIGLISKAGRYGGTYGHKDIAFEFGSAIRVPFALFIEPHQAVGKCAKDDNKLRTRMVSRMYLLLKKKSLNKVEKCLLLYKDMRQKKLPVSTLENNNI